MPQPSASSPEDALIIAALRWNHKHGSSGTSERETAACLWCSERQLFPRLTPGIVESSWRIGSLSRSTSSAARDKDAFIIKVIQKHPSGWWRQISSSIQRDSDWFAMEDLGLGAQSSTQLRPQELFLFNNLKQLRAFVFKVTLAPLLAEHLHYHRLMCDVSKVQIGSSRHVE